MVLKKPFRTAVSFSVVLFVFLLFFSFVSAGKDWLLFYAKLVWSLVVAILGFCIYKNGEISKYRSILFILTAFFFLAGFKFFHFLSNDRPILPYCHIAQAPTLSNFIHSQFLAFSSGQWEVWGILSLGFLWLLIMFTIGQGICSWVCFYGGIDEACAKIIDKPALKINIPGAWRDFPLAFLIFLLIVSFVQGLPVFCNWFCPFKLTTSFWDSQAAVRAAQIFFFLLLLVVFVILLPILSKKRTFCALICPFGALVSVCGKISPYKVVIGKDKCTRCGKCFDVCPVFAIENKDSTGYRISSYCNKCGKCIDACPVDAIAVSAPGNLTSIALPKQRQLQVRDIFIFLSLLMAGAVSGSFVPRIILQLTGLK